MVLTSCGIAHQRAWEKKKILHRDVSINNILLLGSMEGSVGLLCDWDLAKTEQQPDDNDPAQGVRLVCPYMSTSCVFSRLLIDTSDREHGSQHCMKRPDYDGSE